MDMIGGGISKLVEKSIINDKKMGKACLVEKNITLLPCPCSGMRCPCGCGHKYGGVCRRSQPCALCEEDLRKL